ncbi:MAG: aminotransferase class I/II-fold pyridoxal phosphate-dependent enzyme [Verrucomicrobiales bacterium]|nr:aminotransferase class I/II-fold pyridoxal phosphate-dependent enzyme [Verrucomicrobiales bacterium]
MKSELTRRSFLARSASGLGFAAALQPVATRAQTPAPLASVARPALLGGPPVRQGGFPGWPVFDEHESAALDGVLQSGRWFRGSGPRVDEFEKAFAELMGARHCIATANGTSALLASLGGMEIGPGDEVILPPYTFVATLNVILDHYALPVFVDSDLETFQIDAQKVEAALTDRTAAIIPVHLGGGAADLDTILEVARRRPVRVIEDACQSHLAEWRNRRVGTVGDTGCFSFQASKNLNCGEGGAILTNDPELAVRCYAFHNNGRGREVQGYDFRYTGGRAANLRLTEFQGALLLAQMRRIEAQARNRDENGAFLNRLLEDIPGIHPARMYDGCTRNAWHLYMFRYDADHFAGLSRDRFIEALRAEGIPCSAGYSPLNREAFIRATLESRGYRRIYPARLIEEWAERNACPQNDTLCRTAVWLTQNMLLGERGDMDQIADAIRKIRKHAALLKA